MYKNLTIVALALIVLFLAGQVSADSHTDPDFNDDGIVNLADYGLFVSHWGTREGGDNWDAKFDLDGDGVIALGDYDILVSNWGKTFPVSPSGGGGSSDGGVLVTGLTNLTNNKPGEVRSLKPVWSPDGRFILFTSGPGGIYRMDSDGSNRIRLTDYSNAGDAHIHPVWSPDGRFIAFASWHKGNLDIYRMDSDGSNVTQLTLKPDGDEYPSWSPDGRFIAFASKRDPGGIYRMDSDGSNVTLLREGGSWPAWSPDGRFIAFTGHDGWDFQIQRMDSDGRNETGFLTETNPGSGIYALWSPDSRFIAFDSWFDAPGPNKNIYVMDSDGNNLIPLVPPSPARDTGPVWSPDGRFIAFTSNRDSPEDKWPWTDIYIVGSDGNNLTRVNLPEQIDGSPAWSPDGRFIAFTSDRDGIANIYRVEIKFGPGGETILIFPDRKLNLAIGHSLGKKGVVPSITSSEMATLRTLSASNKDISDLTGLEHATNLTELNLTSNRIVDITPLTGLTNLTRLFLGGNNISDLAPLVANTGLGRGDEVDVRENALSTTSRNTHIPALQARGVNVRF